jgi:HEPN domain-containing protein
MFQQDIPIACQMVYGILARVYTSDAAKEAVKLAEEIVNFVEGS